MLDEIVIVKYKIEWSVVLTWYLLCLQMKLVAMGYAVIDVPTIITKFSVYVDKKAAGSRRRVLAGEGNGVVELAESISNYLRAKHLRFDAAFWNSSAVEYLRAVDLLLSMPPDYFSPQVLCPYCSWILFIHCT